MSICASTWYRMWFFLLQNMIYCHELMIVYFFYDALKSLLNSRISSWHFKFEYLPQPYKASWKKFNLNNILLLLLGIWPKNYGCSLLEHLFGPLYHAWAQLIPKHLHTRPLFHHMVKETETSQHQPSREYSLLNNTQILVERLPWFQNILRA